MKRRPDPLTPKQRARQDVDFREKGKYAKVNPCQGCGKSAGVEYFSHRLTDHGDWNDSAIVLCSKCCTATDHMENVQEFYAYQAKKGILR